MPTFFVFLAWILLTVQWPATIALRAKAVTKTVSRIAWISSVLNLFGLTWFGYQLYRLRTSPNAYYDGSYDSFLPHFGDAIHNTFTNILIVLLYGFVLLLFYGGLSVYVDDLIEETTKPTA
jgi:predicted permease